MGSRKVPEQRCVAIRHRYRSLFLPLLMLSLLAIGAALLAGHALADTLTLEWDGPDTVRCPLGATGATGLLVAHDYAGSRTVQVTLLGMPAGVTATFSYTDQGSPRESTGSMSVLLQPDTELPVALSFEAAYDARVNTYQLTLHSQLEGVPGAVDNLGLLLVVWHQSIIGMTVLEDVDTVVKVHNGTTQNLTLRLTNLHPSEDRFLVTATSTNASRGWTARAVEGLDAVGWTPWLAFNKSATALFNVSVPHSARAGESTSVILEVRSQADPDAEPRVIVVTYRVMLMANISVELVGRRVVPVAFEDGRPASVDITFRVYNLANGADEVSVRTTLEDTGEPWATARVLPGRLPLDVAGSDYVLVNVVVQPWTYKGEYSLSVNFTSVMGDVWIIEWVVLSVPKHARVALFCDDPRGAADPGGVVEFNVTVWNAGNDLDSYRVALSDVPSGWVDYTQPNEVTLLPTESSSINVRIIVSPVSDAALARTYAITVWGRSARGMANASLGLVVDVRPFHRIEWTYHGAPITDAEAPVARVDILGSIVINPFSEHHGIPTLPFYIANLGNLPTNVSVVATSTEPRLLITVEQASGFIDWRGSLLPRVSVEVPRDVPPGEHWVYVAARCMDEPSLEDRVVPLRLTVYTVDVEMGPLLDVTGPGVTAAAGGGGAGVLEAPDGTMLDLWYNVTNNGTVDIAGLRIRVMHQAPDGSWQTLSDDVLGLAVNATWGHHARIQVRGLGLHKYEATAILGNQSDPYNDRAWAVVNVTVPDSPRDGAGPGTGEVLLGIAVAALVSATAASYVLLRRRSAPPAR